MEECSGHSDVRALLHMLHRSGWMGDAVASKTENLEDATAFSFSTTSTSCFGGKFLVHLHRGILEET